MASNATHGAVTTDWNLTNGKGYILNRDRSHAAAGRLNLQFFLWKASLTYNIHPSIASSLAPNAAIAEVATGSGIWLIDVAKDWPHAQLDGFDYNVRQFPHAKSLPPNVRMRYLDLLQDPPSEFVAKYDFIHTRLLLLVVENGDPRPIIRNVKKLLKPGGWIQWDELDTVHMQVIKSDVNLAAPAIEELAEWSYAGGRHDWTVRIGDFMAEEGLINGRTDFVTDPKELSRAFTEQHLLTAEEFAEGLAKLGRTESAEKYFRLIAQAHEESIDGAGLMVPRVVCIAQKP